MRARAIVTFVSVIAASVIVSALPAGANIPGTVFSTDAACGGSDVNLFAAKSEVHLDGSGLPDTSYFVKVTTPDGTLLGESAGAAISTTNGELDACYGLAALTGFSDAPAGDGEYKVWLSPDPAFPNALSTTDNFRVLADPELPVPTATTRVLDDRTGTDITRQVASVTEGDTFTVHDTANIVGSGATPTGDVTFDLYANGVCDPQDGVLSSETVTLANGSASSAASVPVPLGDPVGLEYSYQVSYAGDDAHLDTRAECAPFYVAIVAADVTTPVVDPGVAGTTTELAFTGSGRAWLAALGCSLLAGGGALLALSRRRERIGVRTSLIGAGQPSSARSASGDVTGR